MLNTYGPTRESRWDPVDWREHLAWQENRDLPWVEHYLLRGDEYPGRDVALVEELARMKTWHPYLVNYEVAE